MLTSDGLRFDPLSGAFITLVPFMMGWLIDQKHRGHMIAFLFLVMSYSWGAGHIAATINWINGAYPGEYAIWIDAGTLIIFHLAYLPALLIPLLVMPLYFPTGKLRSKHWRIPVIAVVVLLIWTVVGTAFRPWPWLEYGIPDTRVLNGIPGSEAIFDSMNTVINIVTVPVFFLSPVAMFMRFRQARGIERTRMKLPMFSVLILLLWIVPQLAFPEMGDWDAQHGYPITLTLMMVFPTSIGIAILRHNLFDIDIVINRAIVYGILTALIIVFYIVLVSIFGVLVQAQTSVLSGLIATGVIAVIFQPLRERLQKIVNRVLYGERDEPALILSRLAHHLETADTSHHDTPKSGADYRRCTQNTLCRYLVAD